MVAASGGLGALKAAHAAAILAALVAGALLVVWLSARTQAVHYLPATKPPAVLADQARTMVRGLGYRDTVHDAAWGFTTTDYMQHLQSDPSPGRWENLVRVSHPAWCSGSGRRRSRWRPTACCNQAG
jgi:hypothetical protein